MFESPWNSSYVRGYDGKYTFDDTYFFTFYSEFGNRDFEATVEACFLGGTLIASLLTNLSLIVPLMAAKTRSVTNHYALNLATADVLFAVGVPVVMAVRLDPRWPLGDAFCRLLPYSQLVCGFMVLWSLTLISIERYRCLTLDPRFSISASSAFFVNVIMWVFALTLFSPIVFWFRYESDLHVCTLMFPRAGIKVSLLFTIIITSFTCIIPLAILVFNYQRIILKMVETHQKWSTPCVQTSSLTRQEQARLNKHIRVMRIALLNVFVVLLMWLPITVVLVLIYVDGDRHMDDTNFFLRSHHFLWSLLIALLNTAVNPFLCGALRSSCWTHQDNGSRSISRILRVASSFN
uniref:Rhodopsin n=1 Tax=Lygus hesperus TaxID=30085 RepID=A0A146KP41_LYGHE